MALLIAEFGLLDRQQAALLDAISAGRAALLDDDNLGRLAIDVPDLRSRLGIGYDYELETLRGHRADMPPAEMVACVQLCEYAAGSMITNKTVVLWDSAFISWLNAILLRMLMALMWHL